MSTHDDRTLALVLRARDGDEEAYDRLFALAYERVRLYVRLRLGRALRDKLDSDDVLQDAYLEAHRAFPQFRWQGEASFSRWLCRIIENRIRGLADHHGAAKRRPPGGMARVSRLHQVVAGDETGPATQAARRDAAERLTAALDTVTDEQREVLMLRFYAGMTLDEIADLTGHSRSSVRRHLGRAARQLGMALAGAA